MVFSSYSFLFLFLPILTLTYYLVPKGKRTVRNGVLLLFSVIFYGWGGSKYLLLLALSITINWFGALIVHHFHDNNQLLHKKLALALTITANIILFGIFKYTDFVISNVNVLFNCEIPLKNIVLPIGISFYTFQGLSYVIDVHRTPTLYLKNPFTVALYITLFPQLVAGPIVRFSDVADDIFHRTESLNKSADGLQRFIFGLAKKIIFADTFGLLVDQAFSSDALTCGLAWIGALAYMLQIYFDFSGYSDMAIGLGKLFGFQFNENFNYPYISTSVTDFWRRWHISLSSWFRDYVYIPLGGNRCNKPRQLFNLTVVWTLTGLWHGASWNYVLWGVYYLIFLIIEKYIIKSKIDRIPTLIRHVIVLMIVLFGWVLFRSENLTFALQYIAIMLGIGSAPLGTNDFIVNFINYSAFWIAGIIGSTPVIKTIGNQLSAHYRNAPAFILARLLFVFSLFLLCIVYIIASSYNAFIYFQF